MPGILAAETAEVLRGHQVIVTLVLVGQAWTRTPADSSLRIAESLDELRDMLPAELYDVVADIADQPTIEDLDI
jgi:EXLDI family protein